MYSRTIGKRPREFGKQPTLDNGKEGGPKRVNQGGTLPKFSLKFKQDYIDAHSPDFPPFMFDSKGKLVIALDKINDYHQGRGQENLDAILDGERTLKEIFIKSYIENNIDQITTSIISHGKYDRAFEKTMESSNTQYGSKDEKKDELGHPVEEPEINLNILMHNLFEDSEPYSLAMWATMLGAAAKETEQDYEELENARTIDNAVKQEVDPDVFQSKLDRIREQLIHPFYAMMAGTDCKDLDANIKSSFKNSIASFVHAAVSLGNAVVTFQADTQKKKVAFKIIADFIQHLDKFKNKPIQCASSSFSVGREGDTRMVDDVNMDTSWDYMKGSTSRGGPFANPFGGPFF